MTNTVTNRAHVLSMIVLTLFLTSTVYGENISDEAQKTFDRHIEAIGGEDNLRSVKSVKMTGAISIAAMGITAKNTIIQKEPNLFFIEQDIPGLGKMVQAYDGKKAWAQDPMQGTREIVGSELMQLIEENDIHADLNIASRYSSAVVVKGNDASLVCVTGIRKMNGMTVPFYLVSRLDYSKELIRWEQVPKGRCQ